MNKQEMYQEIQKMLNEIDTISKSLSSSREFISENSNKRARERLAEIESDLQNIAGKISKINSAL
jgi:methyl-accepting chemotaxis protein